MFGFFRKRMADRLRAMFRNASSLDPDKASDRDILTIWRATLPIGVPSWREEQFI